MIKTYRRPVTAAWWQRNSFYRWYMLRELSCVFITAYALILLIGLYRLTQGADAFAGWTAALGAPVSMLFHAAAFVLVVYHSWTWFKVMPKTLPFVPLSDRAIVTLGVAAAFGASVVVWILVL